MKILHVITSLRTGGAEKLILEMVPLFKANGHQVDVLLFDGADTMFKDKLAGLGVKIDSLGINTWLYNPLIIFRLIPYLNKYDIIHTHNTACQYWMACAKFITKGKSVLVTTEHSTNNRRHQLFFFRPIDKFIYRQYNEIIGISGKASDILNHYIGNGYPVVTIPNGINLSNYKNARPIGKTKLLGIKKSDYLIVKVAGFRQEKDQDTLIRAMALLPVQYHLALVGDGVRLSLCRQLAEKLQLTDRIHFLGIRSDIPEILKTADIVVMSSHYEGLSLSSIEGMCVGKPFVASDVDGLHEIVEGAGLLFEKGNSTQLATIIRQLMTDNWLYKTTAKMCMKKAIQYDIRLTVNEYEQVYKSLFHNETQAS